MYGAHWRYGEKRMLQETQTDKTKIADGQADRQAGRQAGRKAGKKAGRWAGRQGSRKAGRKTGRQAGIRVLEYCAIYYTLHTGNKE